MTPDAGAANRRKAAHHARQALGRDDAVRLTGGRIALFPGCDVDTDVAEFERRAEAAIGSRDAAAGNDLLADYPGDLLPDSWYEEWTQARRDRLRSLLIALLRLGERWERPIELDLFHGFHRDHHPPVRRGPGRRTLEPPRRHRVPHADRGDARRRRELSAGRAPIRTVPSMAAGAGCRTTHPPLTELTAACVRASSQ
ncbi:MAG TPA: hypothetical protein VNA11_01875 [Pseudonocardia sp.]|nr:hypothetical protein [Pseudonocardia sp.]